MHLSQSRALAVAAVLTVAVAVAGCDSGSDSGSGSAPAGTPQPAPSGSAPAAANAVDIKNFAFNPAAVTVTPGAAVTWTFDDSTDHQVVADDNSFSSQAMGSGTFSHTFATAGTVPYHCSIHPFMKASVTVK
jgi:plastocyanin